MSKYTFKCPYGDYSFTSKQIEDNPYTTREEKEIMHGLANWQSSVSTGFPKPKPKAKPKRRELTVYEDLVIDFKYKRWYETNEEFIRRMVRKHKPVKKYKEVKRTNLASETSLFEDGTEVTYYDKVIQYFI